MARSATDRRPRVRPVSPDDLQGAINRLETLQGEIAAVAARMRQTKLKQLTITGWGKYERALDLLQQFSAHAEFAIKTAPTKQ